MKKTNDRLDAWRALAAGIFALALIGGCEKSGGREVMATVLSVRGNAAVMEEGKQITGRSLQITTGSSIAVRNQIRTQRDAAVALALIPGIFIEVGEATDLGVERLQVVKNGDAMVHAMKSRFAVVQLKTGVIRASFREFGSGRCEFEVQTNQGTVIVRSKAIFSVQVNAETVRVICIRGETSWKDVAGNLGNPTPAGHFRDYVANGANNLRAASEDPQVEEEVLTALDTANSLEKLALRARNAPAPWRHH